MSCYVMSWHQEGYINQKTGGWEKKRDYSLPKPAIHSEAASICDNNIRYWCRWCSKPLKQSRRYWFRCSKPLRQHCVEFDVLACLLACFFFFFFFFFFFLLANREKLLWIKGRTVLICWRNISQWLFWKYCFVDEKRKISHWRASEREQAFIYPSNGALKNFPQCNADSSDVADGWDPTHVSISHQRDIYVYLAHASLVIFRWEHW